MADRKAQRRPPVIYLVPNLFTALALLAGFYAILRANQGDFISAGWAIIFASVMDMLDGRVARMTNAQSEFGGQFDSLSDIVCFGVAPAVVAFEWGLDTMGRAGFASSFFFCAAAAVRLARFNVNLEDSDPNYFTGLPSPMAGVTVASAILVYGLDVSLGDALIVLLLMVILAVSMVSEVHYASFKTLDLRARLTSPLLIMGALLLLSLAGLVMLEFGAGGILTLSLLYLVHGYWHTGRLLLREYKKYAEKTGGSLMKFIRAKLTALLERGDDSSP